ncbi:nitrate- and nitrite sensing domain-containing protein [Streptomyces sp. TRM64462]|uniref:sensor histidine kinase n=1 Tax=Streptomyces sp. TRM64462 TaxID=2741726 RepID=UPI0028152B68|nr:nitrate- and nitrite sensing domain-containing protein [Streptomyces sp. TRM64462]
MQKRSDTPGDPLVPGGRGVRVRNRLVAGVALVGITVIGAGAPGLLTTSADLTEAQRLVTLAELNRQAVTLAHSLADERDEVTAYIAAGRNSAAPENGTEQGAEDGTGDAQDGQDGQDGSENGQDGSENGQDGSENGQDGSQDGEGQQAADAAKPGLPGTHTARVDRQIAEIRTEAPDDVRRALAGVPALRRAAVTGNGTAMEAHRAYTEVIGKLQAVAGELADRTPARAAGTGRGPAELGQAVERASATRGLLLAALAVPGADKPARTEYDPATGRYVTREDPASRTAAATRDGLSAAAHLARVREQVALADFEQTAGDPARDSLAATVTGPEVTAAEDYLDKLADKPELSKSERGTDPEKLAAALTARVEQMRGVESTLATGQIARMEQLRDDDVTALELRIALLGGCLIIAIAVSTAVARTLTRPLAVLRLGAARVAAAPESEEPVRFTGRNDEFAQVVRSLNTLHGKLLTLSSRAGKPDGERAGLDDERKAVAAEPTAEPPAESAAEPAAEPAARHAELRADTARLTAELERLRHTVDHSFVNLSLRALVLVERQLAIIETLEEREQDPEQLDTLFKIDHMATVMRRYSENLLILAGHEHRHAHQEPVPLVDVLRAAVSEIERYERVAIQSLPPHAYVAGSAADDLSHLVAELLENATSFSPPDAQVQLSGWLLESGDVMLSVQDKGIGITPARRAELNARLADPATEPGAVADEEAEGLGLRVAALLAARHGVRVELREEKQGGTAAVVVLPGALLPEAPPTAGPPSVALASGAAPTLTFPGSVAEANSNTLPARERGAEPVAEAADAPEPADADQVPGEAPVADAPDTARTDVEDDEPSRTAAAVVDMNDSAGETHETTLQVRLPQPAPEPDAHERVDADPAPKWERVTDKGLPKRTPQVVESAAPRTERTGGIDAEELRRRLGGFQQGAKEGRRDAEAEVGADVGAEEAAPETEDTPETGDTVEEARS